MINILYLSSIVYKAIDRKINENRKLVIYSKIIWTQLFNRGHCYSFLNFSLLLALHRKELQELQNLYRQNITHTAQQAELIQQLQALNTDTQKVLKDQEDAHTAETTSYQKVCQPLYDYRVHIPAYPISRNRVIKALCSVVSFGSLDSCYQNMVGWVTLFFGLIISQNISLLLILN